MNNIINVITLLIIIWLSIDRYWIEPRRYKKLINRSLDETIHEFEAKIPDDKFVYVKTKCPDCGKNLT